MKLKILLGAVIILIIGLIIYYIQTTDLSTYRTYDIGEHDEEIVSCFDYDDTVYSNYLCVEEFLNEQKIENPTDEPVVLRIVLFERSEGGYELEYQTPYINTKIDSVPDWWSEYSTNPYLMSRIRCSTSSEKKCYGLGDLPKRGLTREEAIEQFNEKLEEWEFEDIQYNEDTGVIVFPEGNPNNEKYLSLLSINEESMDEFWAEVDKGVESGEIKTDY